VKNIKTVHVLQAVTYLHTDVDNEACVQAVLVVVQVPEEVRRGKERMRD
jgi:hypothetical protein